MNNEKIVKKTERNYGLEILRSIMCFWVIVFHCLKTTRFTFIKIFKQKMFHIPCFFFISFFFLYPVIIKKNKDKMILRLERLLIPYIAWPITIWVANNIIYYLLKKSRIRKFLQFKYLKKQLIIGRVFLTHFWFLFNLLFFTIIFFILIHFFKKRGFLVFVQITGIISYFLQYSEYNYIFFEKFSSRISHTIGHFAESFPIAAAAFTLSETKFVNNIKGNKFLRTMIILYSFIALFFIYKYGILKGIPKYSKKYTCHGIDKNAFSFFIFIGASLIPLNECMSNKLKIFIKLITNYTQGIYCMHRSVEYYSLKYLKIKPNIFGCTFIYIFSYLISFLGVKLFGKTKIRYLFV